MTALGMRSLSNRPSVSLSVEMFGVASTSPSIFGAALVFHKLGDRVTPINTLREMITGVARAAYIKMVLQKDISLHKECFGSCI